MKTSINVSALIICLLFSCVTLKTFAEGEQTFDVKSNDSIVAIVSEREISRIAFYNDQIEKIYSMGGELFYEIDGSNLYIKPLLSKPVNFFVNTEKGNIYKFIITTKDIPAVQIFVDNKDLSPNSLKSNELKSHESDHTGEGLFRSHISKMIAVVLAGDEMMGYVKKPISAKRKHKKGIVISKDSLWQGNGFIAEKSYLKNILNAEIKINEDEFLTGNTEVVYLEHNLLLAGDETVLITIKRGK